LQARLRCPFAPFSGSLVFKASSLIPRPPGGFLVLYGLIGNETAWRAVGRLAFSVPNFGVVFHRRRLILPSFKRLKNSICRRRRSASALVR